MEESAYREKMFAAGMLIKQGHFSEKNGGGDRYSKLKWEL